MGNSIQVVASIFVIYPEIVSQRPWTEKLFDKVPRTLITVYHIIN